MRRHATVSHAILGLLWLAAFSLLYTVGSTMGLWPVWGVATPLLRLRADLPAGLAFGVALGVTLLRGPREDRPRA